MTGDPASSDDAREGKHHTQAPGIDESLRALNSARRAADIIETGVNSARKAIGDTGDAQRLIRTYSRKGFRFVGEVRESTRSAGPTARSGSSPTAPCPSPMEAKAGG